MSTTDPDRRPSSTTAPRRTPTRRAAPRRRRALGVDAIVDVALHLVDTEGVDAVSMRRVAAEFDTGPASLYAHVPHKEELLTLVLARVVAEVPEPEGETWQEILRSWVHGSRAVLSRHNDVARLAFGRVPEGDAMLNGTEKVLAAMLGGGVPKQVCAWALDVLALYVAADCYEGWLYTRVFDDGSGRDPQAVAEEYFGDLAERFAALPRDRYPAITSVTTELMTGGGEARFAFGVDMMIAGFESQVPGRRRRR